jgi:uncharacterized spore protein YtfJ
MPGKLDDVVNNLLAGMHQISKIETIVGEPLQAGDAMLVPIHRLRVGFGVATVGAGAQGTSAEGHSGGRGVGGGVQVEPIAVVAIGKDGRPKIMAVDGEPEQMLGQLFEQIPDLVGRIIGLVSSRKHAEEDIRLDVAPSRAALKESKETKEPAKEADKPKDEKSKK